MLHTGVIPRARVEHGASSEAEQSSETIVPPCNTTLGHVWLQSGSRMQNRQESQRLTLRKSVTVRSEKLEVPSTREFLPLYSRNVFTNGRLVQYTS